MAKMDFFSSDKILIFAADEEKKKGKKGDGLNAILGLIQELRNFMEKVENAAEAQDISENKAAVEAINNALRENSKKLLDIVANGLSSEVSTIRGGEAPTQMDAEPMKVEKSEGGETLAPEAPATPSAPKSPYLSGLQG